MRKKVITSEEFIDRFVECLEKGEDFRLEDCIVEGDIDILDIYKRIKERIKDEEKLKELITEQKYEDILKRIIKSINININIYISHVEFNNSIKLYYTSIETNRVEKLQIVFNGNIRFYHTKFNGIVDFNDTKFFGYVDFYNSEFNEGVDFNSSRFFKYVNFHSTKFNSIVNFNSTKFNRDVNFYNAKFSRDVDFSSSRFNGDDINFYMSEFNGDVSFYNAKFSGDVDFNDTKFNRGINFYKSEFNGDVYFRSSEFNGIANFRCTKFNGMADFSKVTTNKMYFKNSTFKSRADFIDILFNLLLFVDCTFEDLALFRKGKIKFEEYEKNKIDLEKPNKQWIYTIINIIKDECLAIFLNTQFLNKHTKIENFPLSKTSFLKTDVREVMLLCDIKKEDILSHKLLKIKKNENRKDKNANLENKLKENAEEIYKEAYEILKSDLDYKSVLAEYRNLRISIENNRTYVEASNLYKMEMELIKEFSDNKFERFAIWFYGAISDYGESIKKPIIFMLGLIIFTPLILTFTAKYTDLYTKIMIISNLILCPPSIIAYFVLSPYINSLINTLIAYIPENVYKFVNTYADYLKSVLGAKFYTGNGSSLLEIIIFCIYSILMMITTANLYIALRRKLSRK
jgi:hypothetical protein